jgi:hypothetical protein
MMKVIMSLKESIGRQQFFYALAIARNVSASVIQYLSKNAFETLLVCAVEMSVFLLVLSMCYWCVCGIATWYLHVYMYD